MTKIAGYELAAVNGGTLDCTVNDPINPMTGTGPTFPTILSCE